MHKAAVRADGSLLLGQQAERLGFAPGVVVEVIATRAGTLILAVDQSPPPIDAPFRPIRGGGIQLLGAGRGHDRR